LKVAIAFQSLRSLSDWSEAVMNQPSESMYRMRFGMMISSPPGVGPGTWAWRLLRRYKSVASPGPAADAPAVIELTRLGGNIVRVDAGSIRIRPIGCQWQFSILAMNPKYETAPRAGQMFLSGVW
jgi:hypothetical protein